MGPLVYVWFQSTYTIQKVGNKYLVVQGIQWSKVLKGCLVLNICKEYPKVQGRQRVPSNSRLIKIPNVSRLTKGTKWVQG